MGVAGRICGNEDALEPGTTQDDESSSLGTCKRMHIYEASGIRGFLSSRKSMALLCKRLWACWLQLCAIAERAVSIRSIATIQSFDQCFRGVFTIVCKAESSYLYDWNFDDWKHNQALLVR